MPDGGAVSQGPRRRRRGPTSDSDHDDMPNEVAPEQPRRRRRGPNPESGGQQCWANFPDPLLYSIFQRLSLVEFAAVAGTCKSWRSFAAAYRGEFMASQAPLLCSTDGSGLYDPVHNRIFRHRRLLSLMVDRWNAKILNICHGYLVVIKCSPAGNPPERRLLLLNLFTGDEVADFPLLPNGIMWMWVVLTAPPTSPACVVVARLKREWGALFQHGDVFSCRRGDANWSMLGWYGLGKPIVAGGQLWALEWLSPGKRLLVSGPFGRPRKNSEVVVAAPALQCKHLVEVDGNLLFIEHWGEKGVAYRLGGGLQKMEKVTDLGDRAVLVSEGGFAVLDCPARWGGSANCIYFTCGGGGGGGRLDQYYCRIDALRLEDGLMVLEAAPFPVAPPPKDDQDDPQKKHLGGASSPRAFWVVPSLCH